MISLSNVTPADKKTFFITTTLPVTQSSQLLVPEFSAKQEKSALEENVTRLNGLFVKKIQRSRNVTKQDPMIRPVQLLTSS